MGTVAVESMPAAAVAKPEGMTVFVVVTVTVTTEGAVVGVPETVKVERVVGMTGKDGGPATPAELPSCFSAATVACTFDRWPIVMVAMVGSANVPVKVTRVTESSSSVCDSSIPRESIRSMTEPSEELLTLWFTNSTCPSTVTLVMSLFLRREYSWLLENSGLVGVL